MELTFIEWIKHLQKIKQDKCESIKKEIFNRYKGINIFR